MSHDNAMSPHHSLREQLDAYREESDLARPEMSELASALADDPALGRELARGQRFGRAVAAGLADLSVPVDLEERILAAVQETKVKTALHVSPAVSKQSGRRWPAILRSRRMWYAMAAAAVLLIMLGAGGFYWHRSQQVFEQQQIASALRGFQIAASSSRSVRGLPSDFVLPPLPVKPQRYLPFKTAEGWSAVAVDCTTATGRSATLFIVQQPSKFRMSGLPLTHLDTPGKKVAAWRQGRLLYVLVEEAAKPRAGAMIHRAAAPPA